MNITDIYTYIICMCVYIYVCPYVYNIEQKEKYTARILRNKRKKRKGSLLTWPQLNSSPFFLLFIILFHFVGLYYICKYR